MGLLGMREKYEALQIEHRGCAGVIRRAGAEVEKLQGCAERPAPPPWSHAAVCNGVAVSWPLSEIWTGRGFPTASSCAYTRPSSQPCSRAQPRPTVRGSTTVQGPPPLSHKGLRQRPCPQRSRLWHRRLSPCRPQNRSQTCARSLPPLRPILPSVPRSKLRRAAPMPYALHISHR
jgi:hypothetical protein